MRTERCPGCRRALVVISLSKRGPQGPAPPVHPLRCAVVDRRRPAGGPPGGARHPTDRLNAGRVLRHGTIPGAVAEPEPDTEVDAATYLPDAPLQGWTRRVAALDRLVAGRAGPRGRRPPRRHGLRARPARPGPADRRHHAGRWRHGCPRLGPGLPPRPPPDRGPPRRLGARLVRRLPRLPVLHGRPGADDRRPRRRPRRAGPPSSRWPSALAPDRRRRCTHAAAGRAAGRLRRRPRSSSSSGAACPTAWPSSGSRCSGVLALPICCYVAGRLADLPFPGPPLLAIGSVVFLFNREPAWTAPATSSAATSRRRWPASSLLDQPGVPASCTSGFLLRGPAHRRLPGHLRGAARPHRALPHHPGHLRRDRHRRWRCVVSLPLTRERLRWFLPIGAGRRSPSPPSGRALRTCAAPTSTTWAGRRSRAGIVDGCTFRAPRAAGATSCGRRGRRRQYGEFRANLLDVLLPRPLCWSPPSRSSASSCRSCCGSASACC